MQFMSVLRLLYKLRTLELKMFRGLLVFISFIALFLFLSIPVRAELAVGGAWMPFQNNNPKIRVEKEILTEKLSSFISVFKGISDIITETSLTIGYTLPAFGSLMIDTDNHSIRKDTLSEFRGINRNSFISGEKFGFIKGIANQSHRFLWDPLSAKTLGALVGYDGFYLSGAYREVASIRGSYDTQILWQAGLGFGSEDFGLNFSFRQMEFSQPDPTDLEGKRWMVGGMLYLSPSLFVDANAFYFDRDKTLLQIDTPQTGARVGVRLKF